MISILLNPRFLIGIALVAGLAFSHFTAYRKGAAHVRLEWSASIAAANAEARRLENARQSAADTAARLAAERARRIAADSARANASVRGLRDALNHANRAREESASAAAKRAAALGELLAQGAEAHRELAERCDRHVNDLRQFIESWPK